MALQSKKRAVTALLVNVSRLLLAAVLVVSGFVKAVDPVGLSYKLGEYAGAFGLLGIDEGWLLFGATMLSAAEFLLGVFLLMGVYNRVVTSTVFLFFLFFTPFTLILALWNPVRDCGCFGDALVLSNWATFGKNVVLLICALLLQAPSVYSQNELGEPLDGSRLCRVLHCTARRGEPYASAGD